MPLVFNFRSKVFMVKSHDAVGSYHIEDKTEKYIYPDGHKIVL